MEIALIDRNNFGTESLDDFSRYQSVKNVYRISDGKLHLVYHPFTEDWTPERKREKAKEALSGRYIAYGAFEDGAVVGLIMLRPGLNMGRMMIDSFHVSTEHRRRGIGRALFEAARKEAAGRGANALYASACSAQETVDFYMAMGFAVSKAPIPSCVAEEPWDIQMECEF